MATISAAADAVLSGATEPAARKTSLRSVLAVRGGSNAFGRDLIPLAFAAAAATPDYLPLVRSILELPIT